MQIYGLLILVFLVSCRDFESDLGPIRADQKPGDREARALAAQIDARLAARWEEAKIRPAAMADDGEFLRRANLDLVGKIPTAAEARDFLNDPDLRKRAALVDRLLDSPAYAARTARLWRQLLLLETDDQAGVSPAGLEAWLRKKIDEDAGYDQIIREVLAARLGGGGNDIVATAARAVARGILHGPRRQAGGHRGRRGPRLPRHPRAMCPVPQPPIREVEAGRFLELRRLLRRRPPAGG